MPLKVDLVDKTEETPLFIIINDKEIYPVKKIIFKNKNNEFKEIIKSFVFDTGILFFIDLFDKPHYYINYDNNNSKKYNIIESLSF